MVRVSPDVVHRPLVSCLLSIIPSKIDILFRNWTKLYLKRPENRDKNTCENNYHYIQRQTQFNKV